MNVGDYFHGTITGGGDISDWIEVNLVAGQEYTIALTGIDALTDNLRDTYLRIRDSAGTTIVAENDDISSGDGYYYSTVTFTAGTTGSFYIDVQSWTNTYDGQYGVSVVEGSRASYDAHMGAGMLLSPNASWATSPGTGATVSWAIRASGNDPANGSPLITPSAAQITAIEDVLDYIEAFSGLIFSQVNPGGASDSATMLFGAYSQLDGRGAYAYYPDDWGGASPDTAFGDTSGDVWLNNTSVSTTSLPIGSYSYFTVLHEIGHALGLAHPGPYNAGGGPITYANDAEFSEDTHQYTVMSYFDETNSGASAGLGYPDTFMLYDLLALHQLYGADMTFHGGNTTYGFNATVGGAYDFTTNTDPFLCIWDGSGTDTLDLSGYAMAQVINLAEGAFSNVGGFVGNLSIAYGAVIENAIGGDGADTITGNSANNTLTGNGNSDRLYGKGGHDTLLGGDGFDRLYGGNGYDSLDGGNQADQLFGEGGFDTLSGGAGSDTLDGGAGNDRLAGGTHSDTMEGGLGNDTLIGATGYDTLLGGSGDDRLLGGGGRDSLDGGDDNDSLDGGGGLDTLLGGSGNDTLLGGGARDTLEGGAGNDTLSGGSFADDFVFTNGFGNDVITDFAAANVNEDIDLSGVTAITNYADLLANHMSQVGADVVIDDLLGNTITIENVTLASMDATNFIF